MSDVKPGFRIEFFFQADVESEKIRAHRSLLYDVDAAAGRMVIAQSSPPLPAACVGQKILLTYLGRKGGHPVRFGFPARILSLLTTYQIASRQRVPALLIQQEQPPRPLNVRLSFRVKPAPSDGMALQIGWERVNMINISLGGAVINGLVAQRLRARDRVGITLTIDGRPYGVDAVVVRVWSASTWESGVACPYLAALTFADLPRGCEDALGKKILLLERKRLAQEAQTR